MVGAYEWGGHDSGTNKELDYDDGDEGRYSEFCDGGGDSYKFEGRGRRYFKATVTLVRLRR